MGNQQSVGRNQYAQMNICPVPSVVSRKDAQRYMTNTGSNGRVRHDSDLIIDDFVMIGNTQSLARLKLEQQQQQESHQHPQRQHNESEAPTIPDRLHKFDTDRTQNSPEDTKTTSGSFHQRNRFSGSLSVISQVSRTESDINEMTEADQNVLFYCPDQEFEQNSSKGDILVERGLPSPMKDVQHRSQEFQTTKVNRPDSKRTVCHQLLLGSETGDDTGGRCSRPNHGSCQHGHGGHSTNQGVVSHAGAQSSTGSTNPQFQSSAGQNQSLTVETDGVNRPSVTSGPASCDHLSGCFGPGTGNFSSHASNVLTSQTFCVSHDTRDFSVASAEELRSRESTDFRPNAHCGAVVGQCGIFDSLNSDGHRSVNSGRLQLVTNVHEQSDCSDAQSITTPKEIDASAEGHVSLEENSSICSQVGLRTAVETSPPQRRLIQPTSNCESCGFMDPHSPGTFGGSGYICESCGHQPSSFAADTNTFNTISGPVYKSHDSQDSWRSVSQGCNSSSGKLVVIPPPTGNIFDDDDDDEEDDIDDAVYSRTRPDSQFNTTSCNEDVHSNAAKDAMSSSSRSSRTRTALHDNSKASHSGHVYGGFNPGPAELVVASQFGAYGLIRGSDTQEFYPDDGDKSSILKKNKSVGRAMDKTKAPKVSSDSGDAVTKVADSSSKLQAYSRKTCNGENDLESSADLEMDEFPYEEDPSNIYPGSPPDGKGKGLKRNGDSERRRTDGRNSGTNRSRRAHSKDSDRSENHNNTRPVSGCSGAVAKPPGRTRRSTSCPHPPIQEILPSDDDTARGDVMGACYNGGGRGDPPRLARSYSERVDENGNDKKDGSNGRSAAINRAELQIMNRLFFSHNNYYSAYFCCAEADDDSFGRPFHHQLEEWGFRIFYAIRDLQLNGPKYDNMANAIEERCNGKIIVVLSHNYLKSDECLFLTYFARTLDPDSKKRNIIPVMIDRDVEIINVLKGLAIIKYNHDFKNNWLKKKIVDAIAA